MTLVRTCVQVRRLVHPRNMQGLHSGTLPPPRHLCELRTRAIVLLCTQSGYHCTALYTVWPHDLGKAWHLVCYMCHLLKETCAILSDNQQLTPTLSSSQSLSSGERPLTALWRCSPLALWHLCLVSSVWGVAIGHPYAAIFTLCRFSLPEAS